MPLRDMEFVQYHPTCMPGTGLLFTEACLALAMESGCGIYRTGEAIQATCAELARLKERLEHVSLGDRAEGWNTEWLSTLELAFQLDVAQAMAQAALARRESRGAHQRLDSGCTERDDAAFLRHSLAYPVRGGAPRIEWSDVVTTRSPPAVRAYGAAGEKEAAHA